MKQHLLHAFLAVCAVFAPEKSAMITVLVLIAVDLVTGIYASYKSSTPITSSGFRRTVTKVAVYEIALMCAFLAQTYLLNNTISLANIVASFIGLTEFTSIVENLNSISGGNLLAALVTKLGSINNTSASAPQDTEVK